MRRTAALLFLVLGSGALVSLFGARGFHFSPTEVDASAPATPAPLEFDYAADYGRFAGLLGAYLNGEDGELGALRESARELATRHRRDDAPRAVEYYASLSTDERLTGLDDYYRFGELWQRVEEAKVDGWQEARAEILGELEALVAETIGKADFVPAGRGLSLSARIAARELRSLDLVALADRRPTLEDALRDAREALAIFERAGLVTPRLEPLWTLGQLEQLQFREEDAWGTFEECRELAIHTHQPEFREHALIGLIQLARAEGNVPELKELVRELASFRPVEECWPLAKEHASQLLHSDESERTAEFLLRVRPGDSDELIEWRLLLALTRLRQGDALAARALLEKIDPRERREDELLAFAKVDLAEQRFDEVISRFGGGGEVETFSHRGRRYARTLLGEALHGKGNDHAALAALESARRIGEGWEARLAGRDSLEATTASVIGEWQGLHTAALEARVLARLGRELEAALVIERAQAGVRQRASGDALALEDLLGWAARFEHGLVTWVAGADHGLVVHVAADGTASALEIDHSRREVRRAVRRFREAVLLDDLEGIEGLSTELCETLLPEGLRRELRTANGEGRLLCLAHGPFERLALEALRFEGRALDELVAVLVLPQLLDPRPGEPPALAAPWRLLGDPVDAGGGVRLPAANAELSEVASILGAAELSARDEFTREVCLEALHESAPLHLVTHLFEDGGGCAGPRFGSVGLELSAGEVLCAEEIAGIDNTSPVVVLAACETSGGRFIDGRGQQGLARAFLEGGTRDLLVTLWPVEDDSARRFTPLFHRALLAGEPPSHAARTARRTLARNGERIADWAAFRVLGRD